MMAQGSWQVLLMPALKGDVPTLGDSRLLFLLQCRVSCWSSLPVERQGYGEH